MHYACWWSYLHFIFPQNCSLYRTRKYPDRELPNWTCTKTHCDTNRPVRGNSTTFFFVLQHKQHWVDMKNICRPHSPWNSHTYSLNYVRLWITMSHYDSYPRWCSAWPISHHKCLCPIKPLAEKMFFIIIFVIYKLRRPNKIDSLFYSYSR